METDALLQHSHDGHITDVTHDESRITYNAIAHTQCGENGESRTTTRVYKLRWYILLVFSLSATLQNAAWGTWGPVAQSAKAVYDWTNPILTVIINCGNIGVFIGLVPVTYLVSFRGLRPSVILCTFCLGVGCGLRVVSFHTPIASILIGVGQFCIGVAGSVTTVIPPVISETWFPVQERTTATALGIISNAVGGMAAFLLGPNIVSQPAENTTIDSNLTEFGSSSVDTTAIKNIKTEIRLLLFIEFVWGAALFLMTLVYYPTKPAIPPSQSASRNRLDFKEAFSGIIRNINVVQISLVCAIPWACFGNWLGLLDLVFHGVGVTQTQAGWYGFYACLTGTVAGMVVSRITDLFGRKHRLVLLSLYISAVLFMGWITAISNEYLIKSHGGFTPDDLRMNYKVLKAAVGSDEMLWLYWCEIQQEAMVLDAIAISLLSLCLNSAMPVIYEVACETAYPAGEEMVGLFIGIAKNATAVVFLLAGIVQNTGVQWMNWVVLGVIACSIPVLTLVKIQYNRIELDSDHTD